MKVRCFLFVALIIAVFVVTGCQKEQAKLDYDRPLPPGQLALRRIINPADIPDFTMASYNVANLRLGIDSSLNYLSKPSSQQFFPYGDITHDDAVASLKEFRSLLDSGLRGPQLNEAIRHRFDVYMSVGCDDKGTVLFTGYYTPIFDGSAQAGDRFRYPLYSQPQDLVKGENGRILGRRGTDGGLTPYPARAQIESSNMLAGEELVWLGDPFESYITHVQGSAKIRMPDGRLVTYGYAANNGHDYQSISKQLVSDGRISADRLSLASMIEYFRNNPTLVPRYTQLNPRFVFFREQNGPPRGSLNEPVIPYRTIATDKSIYPRACLAFLDTRLPREITGAIYIDPYSGFCLDQDTGGAIRAAGRCDVYMGQGDSAGRVAGKTYQEGRLYYLFLKTEHQLSIASAATLPPQP